MPNDNQNSPLSPQNPAPQAARPFPNDEQGSSSYQTVETPTITQTTTVTEPTGFNAPTANQPVVSTSQTINPSVLNPTTTLSSTTTPTVTSGDTTSPDSIVTSAHVPEKYGGKKVIATIFSILFIVGAVVAGVALVQRQLLLQQEAASGSACDQSPDCELVDNAPNSGSKTVSRPIIYVDITDQDYHRYNPGATDDGCRKVNIQGNTVTWEKYGSGSECKDVSNVQIWMGNLPSNPPATATNSPTVTVTDTPPTTVSPLPTKTISNTNSPSPSTSVTQPPGISAQCNNVIARDEDGNELTTQQLSQTSPGDTVIFTVSGQTNSGSFTKARFTVNNVLIGESTTQNTNNEYYIEYEIPTNTQTFSVKGELLHSSLGWI